MATMYITEYRSTGMGTGGAIQVASEPRLADQTVTIGSEADSAAFNAGTNLIRLHCDAICSFTIGTAPTATTSMARMVAGQTEYFAVSSGQKISVISNT